MKKVMLSLIVCAAAFAQSDAVVRWRGIEGVITAPGVDNPVSQIHSGAGPWTTRSGSARIDLQTGEGSFEVEGLVLNGGNACAYTTRGTSEEKLPIFRYICTGHVQALFGHCTLLWITSVWQTMHSEAT